MSYYSQLIEITGQYGGLSRFANLTIHNLNGPAVISVSLGMYTGTTASSWTHPPMAPPKYTRLKSKTSGKSMKMKVNLCKTAKINESRRRSRKSNEHL